MKTILNFIKGTLIAIWAIIAIFVTICLLAFNEYGVSEFGDYSLFIIDNKSLEPDFHKNDIVIIEKGLETDYKVGEKIFFYFNNTDIKTFVNNGEITDITVVKGAEDTFSFGEEKVSFGNVIGHANGAIVIKKAGLVLKLVESRWGFMFCIILPTIYAVVYEIYSIVSEVKKELKKDSKKESEDDED